MKSMHIDNTDGTGNPDWVIRQGASFAWQLSRGAMGPRQTTPQDGKPSQGFFFFPEKHVQLQGKQII